VSRRAFAHNVRQIKLAVGPGVGVMAVLKADAYGHGAEMLAPIAVENGASMVGVSSLEEGIALRDAGVKNPILILGGIFPLNNFSVAIEYNLTPTIASMEAAQQLAQAARAAGVRVKTHLKVDTGMGRIGVSPIGAKAVLVWIKENKDLELTGVYSHLATADCDADITAEQRRLFESVIGIAQALEFPATFHIANSAGALRYPDTRFGMIRPGLALYGTSYVPLPAGVDLKPVLSLHTRIVFMKKVLAGTPLSYAHTFRTSKESVIATLPIGYADGVPRAVSNKAQVLVKGRRCPIVGRVTMDHIMIDVTGVPADVGDEVVLIGQQSDESISVTEWADWAGTIAYEIFTGLSKRVPRTVIE
jgi:alanine racemase